MTGPMHFPATATRAHDGIAEIVFSDLDGTLLDAELYECGEAEPALEALRQRGVPLVFCTSKTRAEVEFWRRKLWNTHPFIVENGAAIFVPPGCFPFAIPSAVARSGYEVIEFGTPRPVLINALESASRETGCRVRAFYRMSESEIAAATGLPLRQVRLAARREYDEPFEILGPDHGPVLNAIEERGLRWTRGGRFYHVTGGNDKALAVRRLSELYRKAFGTATTAGLGDAPNDIGFLKSVDIPIVVRSGFAAAVSDAVPRSRVTAGRGAAGWNEAVLRLLAV